MGKKKGILINKEWDKFFLNIEDEKAGQMIKAVFTYDAGKEVEIEDPTLAAIFQVIKNQMDEHAKAYEETCRRNKEAQEKRWKKEKDTNVYECTEKDTDVYERIRSYSNASLSLSNHNKGVSGRDKGGVGEKEKEEGEKKPKPQKHKYGEYKNVLLTDAEKEKLMAEFPDDWQDRVERLSEYIQSKGVKYKDHLATIRSWARRENKDKGVKLDGNGAPEGWAKDYDRRWGYA